MNGKHMSNPLKIFLDGLDASTDGRGYDAEHERARMLLEAAPDLLEALETMVELEALRGPVPADNFVADILRDAKAAIAKAKGE